MERDLLSAKIDAAILCRCNEDPRLVIKPYAHHRVVVIVNESHPWAARTGIDMKELSGQEMVLRITENSLTGPTFKAALDAAGIKPKWIMEVDSRETMREAVAAGVGIGAIIDLEASADRRLKALQILDVDLKIAESVVCLRQRSHLPPIRSFCQLAKKLTNIG